MGDGDTEILGQHRQHDLQILVRLVGPHLGEDTGAMRLKIGPHGGQEIVAQCFLGPLRPGCLRGCRTGSGLAPCRPGLAARRPGFISHGSAPRHRHHRRRPSAAPAWPAFSSGRISSWPFRASASRPVRTSPRALQP
ncbi:hypothetical protein FJ954_30715 [Mesorhizobium sp. B2-3-15]|nr:hypothetical protein FJ954_30715 [Mesorhizobium sp. B2-3-15]